jgi:CRP-like cAMP-binding protein
VGAVIDTKAAIFSLAEGIELEPIKQGTMIYQENDVATDAFILVDGTVSIWLLDKQTNQNQSVAQRVAGSLIGELSLFEGRRTATVIADTDVNIARISHPALLHWITNQPPIAMAVMASSFEKIAESDLHRAR